MKRKIVFVILLVTIILSTNIVSTLAATKTELQNKQSKIEDQIEQTEGKISEVKDEMSETMKQIQ